MSAFVFQPEHQRLVMHCAADFHAENAQWLSALFSAAVAIQVADAHIKVDEVATLLRANSDESHHLSSGTREELNDMLNVIDVLFAPGGRGPSAFGQSDWCRSRDGGKVLFSLAGPETNF